MNRTYRVNCYAREDLTDTRIALTAPEAIDYADRFVADHCLGAAHIIAEGSDSGIYIARPSDPQRSTRDERISRLESIEFRTNDGRIL